MKLQPEILEMIEKVETSPLTDGDRQDTLTDNDGQEGR